MQPVSIRKCILFYKQYFGKLLILDVLIIHSKTIYVNWWQVLFIDLISVEKDGDEEGAKLSPGFIFDLPRKNGIIPEGHITINSLNRLFKT